MEGQEKMELCYAVPCHGRWLHIPAEELLAPRLLRGTRKYPVADLGAPFAAAGHLKAAHWRSARYLPGTKDDKRHAVAADADDPSWSCADGPRSADFFFFFFLALFILRADFNNYRYTCMSCIMRSN